MSRCTYVQHNLLSEKIKIFPSNLSRPYSGPPCTREEATEGIRKGHSLYTLSNSIQMCALCFSEYLRSLNGAVLFSNLNLKINFHQKVPGKLEGCKLQTARKNMDKKSK